MKSAGEDWVLIRDVPLEEGNPSGPYLLFPDRNGEPCLGDWDGYGYFKRDGEVGGGRELAPAYRRDLPPLPSPS